MFTVNAALTGSVNGEAGSDTLTGTQVGSIVLTASSGNGFTGTGGGASAGFTGIDVINSTGVARCTARCGERLVGERRHLRRWHGEH